VLAALAYGRSESPWVWLIIVGGGMVLYVVERVSASRVPLDECVLPLVDAKLVLMWP
jgi:hypothetical protein